ncbi:hypothetical protein BJF84_10460 [Rhodococcus sp. CUA-806]|nr:hypothetical protein BJF84_10460 [Rhodococcus sp. CUA-806]
MNTSLADKSASTYVLSARTVRIAAGWALAVAAVSFVFRAPGVSALPSIGIAAGASALACIAVHSAGPRAMHWIGALCCTTAVGAMAQIRLGVNSYKVVLIVALAVIALAVVVQCVRRLPALTRSLVTRVATATVAASFVLRVVLPALLDPIDLLYLATGTVAIPGSGVGLQTGEFTRPFLIAAVGIILWQTISPDSNPPSRRQLWTVALGTAGYVAALAVVDNGPAVLTVFGLLLVALLSVGFRRPIEAAKRTVRTTTGLVAVVGIAVAVLLVATQFGSFAGRAPGRFLSLFDPNEQMRAGFEAMQRGGVVGSGMGTSPFALGVPVGKTDLLPAVLAADLGMAVMAALALVVLFTIASVVGRALGVTGIEGAIAVSVGSVLFVQAAWPVLANVGIAPLTGISVPFLVVSTSSLVPAAVSFALIVGTIAHAGNEEQFVQHRPRAERAVNVVRTLVAATVVIAVSILALFVSPVSNAAQIFMPRGDILTADGTVVATTDDEGRRLYPNGSMYTELGMIHPQGAQYAVESAMASQLPAVGHLRCRIGCSWCYGRCRVLLRMWSPRSTANCSRPPLPRGRAIRIRECCGFDQRQGARAVQHRGHRPCRVSRRGPTFGPTCDARPTRQPHFGFGVQDHHCRSRSARRYGYRFCSTRGLFGGWGNSGELRGVHLPVDVDEGHDRFQLQHGRGLHRGADRPGKAGAGGLGVFWGWHRNTF